MAVTERLQTETGRNPVTRLLTDFRFDSGRNGQVAQEPARRAASLPLCAVHKMVDG